MFPQPTGYAVAPVIDGAVKTNVMHQRYSCNWKIYVGASSGLPTISK